MKLFILSMLSFICVASWGQNLKDATKEELINKIKELEKENNFLRENRNRESNKKSCNQCSQREILKERMIQSQKENDQLKESKKRLGRISRQLQQKFNYAKLELLEYNKSPKKFQLIPPPLPPFNNRQANQLFLEAQKAFNATKTPVAAFVGTGQLAEAKVKYHQIVEQYPFSSKAESAAFHLASIYYQENQASDGAIKVFKQCLVINPKTDFDVRLKLGLIYKQKKEGAEAKFWFQEALKKSKDSKEKRQAEMELKDLTSK